MLGRGDQVLHQGYLLHSAIMLQGFPLTVATVDKNEFLCRAASPRVNNCNISDPLYCFFVGGIPVCGGTPFVNTGFSICVRDDSALGYCSCSPCNRYSHTTRWDSVQLLHQMGLEMHQHNLLVLALIDLPPLMPLMILLLGCPNTCTKSGYVSKSRSTITSCTT